MFLNFLLRYMDDLKMKSADNLFAWSDIALQIQLQGVHKNAGQVKDKYKNLLKAYYRKKKEEEQAEKERKYESGRWNPLL